MTKPRPSDVFFFSCPRTLSNLFVKLLSQQQGWEESGYYMHNAFLYGLENWSKEPDAVASPEQRQEFIKQLRESFVKMEEARETAHKNGNALFLKSHINQVWEPSPIFEATKGGEYAAEFTLADDPAAAPPRTNPTLLADEYLTSFVPVFLVRHPALILDSWYRTEARAGHTPDLRLMTRVRSLSPELTRQMYDWYAKLVADSDRELAPGSRGVPIVVDADDILEGDTVHRLAKTIGMDPAQVLESWESKPTDGLIPMVKSYVQGIWESTGIDKSKSSKFLDVEEKYKSWYELYGDEVGDHLVNLTKEFLPAYEYLKSKKM
ncbi:hypothetical protein PWT90_01427 [Aphanocladium album]|nr:hypothetical protein PWT90_01427 [Aphanocladium album]